MPGPSTGSRPAPSTPAAAAPAAVDSGPSAEAQRVLASIPDPLPPGERLPPPQTSVDSLGPSVPDSTEGGGADVPVPTPTRSLGEPEPLALRDSVTMPIQAIDHGVRPDSAQKPSPPPDRRPPPSQAARPDTCWRVQVAAPAKRDEADAKREAAESQLLIPMVVEPEKGLFKVRTRDCVSRESADHLKRRAADAGFAGAFRFVTKRP